MAHFKRVGQTSLTDKYLGTFRGGRVLHAFSNGNGIPWNHVVTTRLYGRPLGVLSLKVEKHVRVPF